MLFYIFFGLIVLFELYAVIKLTYDYKTSADILKSTWYIDYITKITNEKPQEYATNTFYTKVILSLRGFFGISIGMFLAGVYVYQEHSDNLILIISSISFSLTALIIYVLNKRQYTLLVKNIDQYRQQVENFSSLDQEEFAKNKRQFQKAPNLWLLEFIFGVVAVIFILLFW